MPSIALEIPAAKTISLAGRTLEIRWSISPEDRAWDDFLLTLPDAHHEQTSRWGCVRATIGWEVVRIVMTEHGVIIAGAQIQLQALGGFGSWAYLTSGPCLAGDDAMAEKNLLAEIKDFLRHQRVIYLLAQLPYDAHPLAERLQANGFVRPPRAIAPFYMQATLVLDLAKTEEMLLAEMRATTRHQIRQGLKRGLTVMEGGAADLDLFWELMRKLCERRHTTPNPGSPEFFRQLWKQFSPRGWIKLFLVQHEGKTIAGGLALVFGDWFRVWKVGWSGEHAELRPNQLLWWEMIRAARRQGYRHFDFVNLDVVQPGQPAAPKLARDGSTEFKLGFGGTIKPLPGAYCCFIHPLARMAKRAGVVRLLDSEACVTLVRKVRRQR